MTADKLPASAPLQGEIFAPGEGMYVLKGWRYGHPYEETCVSVEEAKQVAIAACDDNTWCAEELQNRDGMTIMRRDELLKEDDEE